MSIALSQAAWDELLQQPDSATRAQALATLLGAGSVEFRTAADALIRTVTITGWVVGATASGKTPITPSSYTDSAAGSGTPAVAVFKDSEGTEVLRCSCGTGAEAFYRLLANIVAGVPIIAGGFAILVPEPPPSGPSGPPDASLRFSGVPDPIPVRRGGPYAFDLAAYVVGGTPPYGGFAVDVGALPTHVTLDSSTGALTATEDATLQTTGDLTFGVDDSASARATLVRKLQIVDVPAEDLPAAGAAKLIAGADWFQTVRPSPIGVGPFRYSIFGSYGCGAFNPHWSQHGAFIAAGMGGHGHQPLLGAVGFDFTTRAPFYVAPLDIAERHSEFDGDFSLGETTGDPYYEVTAVQPACVPAPGHAYALLSVVPPELGGGVKGSMIYVTRAACTRTGNDSSEAAHIFDLATGEWRRATDATSPRGARVESTTIYDPVTRRFYWVPSPIHDSRSLVYLDGNDWAFKTTPPSYPYPKAGNGSYGRAVLYEVGAKRYILHFWGDLLQALDLDNIAAGFREITYTGTLAKQSGTQNAYVVHRAQNVLYARQNVQGQQLHKLIPAADPISGTWEATTVTLAGDTVPEFTRSGTYGVTTEHYRSLVYLPTLQMLGWVTCNGVALLNP